MELSGIFVNDWLYTFEIASKEIELWYSKESLHAYYCRNEMKCSPRMAAPGRILRITK